jgi:hypothetical protein
LNKVGGGSTGPTLGQGRGEDQCSDPRTQTMAEYHINPRTSQRDVRDEEDADITYHYTNVEIGVSGSNRTIAGTGSRSTRTFKRS